MTEVECSDCDIMLTVADDIRGKARCPKCKKEYLNSRSQVAIISICKKIPVYYEGIIAKQETANHLMEKQIKKIDSLHTMLFVLLAFIPTMVIIQLVAADEAINAIFCLFPIGSVLYLMHRL
jgi:hypothetical protein